MDKTKNNSLKYLSVLFVTSFFSFLVFSSSSLATQVIDYENYQGKTLEASSFSAIEGEVYGTVAPGITEVLVNNEKVLTKKDNSFITKISLKEGQSYLTVETRYGNMRFIKKYLVIRSKEVKQPFKIRVSQKDFPAMTKKTKAKTKVKTPVKIAATTVTPQKNWSGFELVAELEPGKLLAVERIDERYFGHMYMVADMVWVPVQEISYWEFRALLEKGVVPAAFMRSLPPSASSEAGE